MAELKIKADSGGGTVSFKGPATTTSNAAVQLTLPVDDGAANQYLKTDGSGAMSWATVAVGGAAGTDYNDNVKVRLGTGNDSEFYYSGTDNYFNVKNGKTFIRTGDEIRIQNDAETETVAKFIKDDGCYLYFNNSSKLSTTNIGVSVTGSLTPSSGIYLGGSGGGNWLDDYEEGSWTATCASSVTLTHNTLYYTKIGRLVHISGYLTVNSDNGGAQFVINNLPFTGDDGFGLSTPTVRLSNWNLSSDCKFVSGYTEHDNLYFQENRDDGSNVALAADSGAVMILSCTYYDD